MPDTYDAQEIIDAVDHLDRLRQMFADQDAMPCALRNELMELHGDAMNGHSENVVDAADTIAAQCDDARESIEIILDVMNRIESTPTNVEDEDTLL